MNLLSASLWFLWSIKCFDYVSNEDLKSGSGGKFGLGHQNQHVASNAPPRSDESHTQPPQLELVAHSIVCIFVISIV